MNFDMKISKSANSLFEVITTYHISYLYVNLYTIVNTRASKKDDVSKADIYMGVLVEATQNYCMQNGYRKNISNLHQYFCRHTKFSNISFKDFIDMIVKEMIPEEYFDSLAAVERHKIVANVLKNTLKHFVNNIINHDKIMLFLDNRINENHIALLKNIYLSIMINERQNIYKKFVAPGITKSNTAEISAKIYELKKELENSERKLQEKDRIVELLKVKLKEMLNAYRIVESNNKYLKERIHLLELNKNRPVPAISIPTVSNRISEPSVTSLQDINEKLGHKNYESSADEKSDESLGILNNSDDESDAKSDNIIEELTDEGEEAMDEIIKERLAEEARLLNVETDNRMSAMKDGLDDLLSVTTDDLF